MKRLAMATTALAVLAVFAVGETEAADWYRGSGYGYSGHSRFHDDLEHQGYHRDLAHRQAHRYPMSWRGHEGLHDDLEHDAYHDDLRHRRYHRSRSGRGLYFGGRRFGIWIGR